jgi:prolyl oligopeptidase
VRPSSAALVLALASCGASPAAAPSSPAVAPAPAASASTPVVGSPSPTAGGPARTVDVVEELFGVAVPDPYRWMEGTGNAETAGWLREQGAVATAAFAALPGSDALLTRLRDLSRSTTRVGSVRLAGDRTFYYRRGADAELFEVMVRERDGSERVLLDPVALARDGRHASIDLISPSPDGSLVAYNVSWGGSEVCEVHVVEVATGTRRPDVIPRVWGEFPQAWLPDGSGFLYSQMAVAAPGADPLLNMQGKLHRLGQPVERDVTVLGGDTSSGMPLRPEEFPMFRIQAGTTWAIAFATGARPETRVAIARLADLGRPGAGTPWTVVTDYADGVADVAIAADRLYLLTYKDAPNRKVVSVPLAAPDLTRARVEIPEASDGSIVGIAAARDALYVRQQVGRGGRIVRRPWRSGRAVALPLPFEGWVSAIGAEPTRDGIVFGLQGWTRPETYFRHVPARGTTRPAGIASTTTSDFSSIVAEVTEVESAGGARVPLTILRRKDLVLDGSAPTMLRGYGAYGVSITPSFDPTRLAWLERGGVLAIAHVRGGGEKGHRWTLDGVRENKMNGVRDFIACAEHLVRAGYTRPDKLTASGGSAGGILVGRALTERPDLFAAVHIAVGAVNPLRILVANNGANQKAEYGDPSTEAGFRSILAVDPYHHVRPGVAYPATLFTVGLNDGRVDPWMTAKMAARMQASTAGSDPILVRVDGESGHGIGSTRDQGLRKEADVQSFLLEQTGDPAFQPIR